MTEIRIFVEDIQSNLKRASDVNDTDKVEVIISTLRGILPESKFFFAGKNIDIKKTFNELNIGDSSTVYFSKFDYSLDEMQLNALIRLSKGGVTDEDVAKTMSVFRRIGGNAVATLTHLDETVSALSTQQKGIVLAVLLLCGNGVLNTKDKDAEILKFAVIWLNTLAKKNAKVVRFMLNENVPVKMITDKFMSLPKYRRNIVYRPTTNAAGILTPHLYEERLQSSWLSAVIQRNELKGCDDHDFRDISSIKTLHRNKMMLYSAIVKGGIKTKDELKELYAFMPDENPSISNAFNW
jgi:hypothetical protein